MKAVLISIQPKWCELIASGKKTVEVRKTKPKIETPFKAYIYMTAGDAVYPVTINGAHYTCSNVGGKCVIGEFVCDRISPIAATADGLVDVVDLDSSCLSVREMFAYSAGKLPLYGWHISNLKIYDKPKSLREFYAWKKCNSCKTSGYESSACIYDEDCKVPAVITRPPQSWCYVEDMQNG